MTWARDWVWGRRGRREFALFWVSVGGPLAHPTTMGRTARVGAIFDAKAEAKEEEEAAEAARAMKMLEQERIAFIKNPVNDSFLRTSLTRVLFVPNTSYRKNIASFL